MSKPTYAERLAMAEKPNEIEVVYSYLLVRFMDAARNQDQYERDRIERTIELFEEFWPEDTARWKARFPGSAKREK